MFSEPVPSKKIKKGYLFEMIKTVNLKKLFWDFNHKVRKEIFLKIGEE